MTRKADDIGKLVVDIAQASSGWGNTTGMKVADVAPLAKLTKLDSLGLQETKVANVASLAKVATLRRLDLEKTNVPAPAVAALNAALPTCQMLDL